MLEAPEEEEGKSNGKEERKNQFVREGKRNDMNALLLVKENEKEISEESEEIEEIEDPDVLLQSTNDNGSGRERKRKAETSCQQLGIGAHNSTLRLLQSLGERAACKDDEDEDEDEEEEQEQAKHQSKFADDSIVSQSETEDTFAAVGNGEGGGGRGGDACEKRDKVRLRSAEDDIVSALQINQHRGHDRLPPCGVKSGNGLLKSGKEIHRLLQKHVTSIRLELSEFHSTRARRWKEESAAGDATALHVEVLSKTFECNFTKCYCRASDGKFFCVLFNSKSAVNTDVGMRITIFPPYTQYASSSSDVILCTHFAHNSQGL